MNTPMIVAMTFTPETRAASSLEPTANIFLPKVVLFHTTHMMAVTKIASTTYIGTEVVPNFTNDLVTKLVV